MKGIGRRHLYETKEIWWLVGVGRRLADDWRAKGGALASVTALGMVPHTSIFFGQSLFSLPPTRGISPDYTSSCLLDQTSHLNSSRRPEPFFYVNLSRYDSWRWIFYATTEPSSNTSEGRVWIPVVCRLERLDDSPGTNSMSP